MKCATRPSCVTAVLAVLQLLHDSDFFRITIVSRSSLGVHLVIKKGITTPQKPRNRN